MAAPAIASRVLELSAPHGRAVAAAVGKDLGRLEHRLEGIEVREIVQPFFARHRILELASAAPMPPLRGYLALSAGGDATVLTGHLGHLNDIAAGDRPAIPDAEHARTYSILGDRWTIDVEPEEMPIDSFDELHWRTRLREADRAQIDALRARFGSEIAPLAFGPDAEGWRLAIWVQSDQRLVRRELRLASTGRLERTDDVKAASIPVYRGFLWGEARGRFVPIG